MEGKGVTVSTLGSAPQYRTASLIQFTISTAQCPQLTLKRGRRSDAQRNQNIRVGMRKPGLPNRPHDFKHVTCYPWAPNSSSVKWGNMTCWMVLKEFYEMIIATVKVYWLLIVCQRLRSLHGRTYTSFTTGKDYVNK